MGILKWEKGKGVTFSASDNGNEMALMILDEMLDDAEYGFKDKMIEASSECFRNNHYGQKHAIRIAALNHCIRDLYSVGFSNYSKNAQQLGRWTDEETQCFMRSLLTSAKKLVNERLDAYRKCKQFRSSDTFRCILKKKEQKNRMYSNMLDRYIENCGMASGVIDKSNIYQIGEESGEKISD